MNADIMQATTTSRGVIDDELVELQQRPFAKTPSCMIYKGEYGGCLVAVKEFFGSMPIREKRKLKQEAESLSKLQHQNIVKFYGVLAKKSSLVLEFLQKVEIIDGEEICIHDVRGLLDNLEDGLCWKVC